MSESSQPGKLAITSYNIAYSVMTQREKNELTFGASCADAGYRAAQSQNVLRILQARNLITRCQSIVKALDHLHKPGDLDDLKNGIHDFLSGK